MGVPIEVNWELTHPKAKIVMASIKNLRSLRNSSYTGFHRYDLLMIEIMSSNAELYLVYLAAEAILFLIVSFQILKVRKTG